MGGKQAGKQADRREGGWVDRWVDGGAEVSVGERGLTIGKVLKVAM